MSQFAELLAQLNAVDEEQTTLAKSIPSAGGDDDQAIQAAAAEGADNANPEDTDDVDENGEPLKKSIDVNGEEVQLVDAEQLIKSIEGLTARADEQEEVLAKGLTSAIKLIQSQGEMIKSLQAQVKAIGNEGAGRKAALTLHEKAQAIPTTLAKSESALTVQEFLGKSEAAWKAGKLSGTEFTEIDVSLRQGLAPKAELVAKVNS